MQAAKLLIIIKTPWKKYSDYFEQNSFDIWGLAPILKYTLLGFFILFLPPIFGLVQFDNGYDDVVLFVFLASMAIWALYLPIFFAILLKRGILNTVELSKRAVHFLTSKPNYFENKNPEKLELIIRGLRYYYWFYSTMLIYKHRKKLTSLTTFYPFTDMFQNKMFHYKNQIVWKTIRKIESISEKSNTPISIDEIAVEPYIHFIAHFTKKGRFPIKRLEKALQKHFDTIYVRNEGKREIRINTTVEAGES